MCGATSFCANSLTVCTSALWSSVNSKSIISLTLFNQVVKMTGHLTESNFQCPKRPKRGEWANGRGGDAEMRRVSGRPLTLSPLTLSPTRPLTHSPIPFAILRGMAKKMRPSSSTTVGLVQMSCDQKPETNLKKAISGINEAAKRGARIICLQELFRSQYFCQTEDIELFKLAETIPGASTEALSKVARQRKVVVIASLFEKRAAGVYHNTAVIIDTSGKIAGKYRKMHIPDDPLY